ncbi:MAG: biosynthetic-type acetolactate synthase large subunit [Acidobacteria bacterium]|nr:MAG: biosynthetic-type acetolactate synthase large subunit [Acidobacteriota bacterium]PYY06247.1 MAG: biosynthetic-type acetolactate synthase large subunit [Acidobacteriota bacterium]
MLKGAQIVLRCLRAEGVDLVFGYPGGAIMPLYDALEGSGVRHILARHEQGAVFAAEGYARSTGRVGVTIATSGPGATNLVTGIADAKMDSVPLVSITGQVRTPLIGTDAFQETDVFGLTLALTKWSRLVRTVEEIPEVIAQAFYWARSGRPGPVMIDIPVDLLKASSEFRRPVGFQPHPRPADRATDSTFCDTAVALLRQAKKPVALVGAGVKLSGAVADLRRVLDCLQVPTFATVHGLGAVSPEKPYYLGMVGMHGTRAANLALNETDLLLVFGARLDDRVTGEPARFAPDARIVHFEIDPGQLDRVRPCELPVIGDLAHTIPTFHQALSRVALPDWRGWQAIASGPDRAEPDSLGLAQPTIRFIDELFRQLPADSTVVVDVGQHQMWAAQRYRSNSPRSFITSGGLGAMGFALPAAIGVQLGNPNKNVVSISGDGGFQMNIQELATVKRLGLPIKMVVVDNKYLGMVRQWQELFYQRNYAETDLSDNPNFVAIAYAYGINGQRLRADSVSGLEIPIETSEQIERFLASSHPELLVFECPPEANVYPMVAPGAALSEMLFEEE